METPWWQDWPGWLITTSLAAAAAWAGIVQEIRHLRSRPNAQLWIERTGEMTRGPERWERFRVSNIGTGPVRIHSAVLIGAVAEYPDGDAHKLPRAFAPGDQHHIVVVPGETDRAWVLLTADHPYRQGWLKVWWLPLDMDGAQGDEFTRQLEARASSRKRLSQVFKRDNTPVGPGGQPVVLLGPNRTHRLEKLLNFGSGHPLV